MRSRGLNQWLLFALISAVLGSVLYSSPSAVYGQRDDRRERERRAPERRPPGVRPGVRPPVGRPPIRPPVVPYRGVHAWVGPYRSPVWYHGPVAWNRWHYYPVSWRAAGVVAGVSITPWNWGYWSYYNPYYTAPVMVGGVAIDYSRPLVVASASADPARAEVAHNQSLQMLEGARTAFMRNDYANALAQADQAVAFSPNDPMFHEFRALTLFAMGRYQEAAGPIYAVLSMGPGWDYATMSSNYPDPNIYVAQLRALEQYTRANPTQPQAKFVLAYHYMTAGYDDAATKQLQAVVQLNPRDQLSGQLVQMLTAKTDPAMMAGQAPAPAIPPGPPVLAANIVGQWNVQRPDGTRIALRLAPDSTYTWNYTQNNQRQEFRGTYTVANNTLTLSQNGAPAMVGQVALLPDGRFNFKIPGPNGPNPDDPGLTFAR